MSRLCVALQLTVWIVRESRREDERNSPTYSPVWEFEVHCTGVSYIMMSI